MPDSIVKILTNKEVIALNQDLFCRQGVKVVDNDLIEIYVKPLVWGEYGICVFNRGKAEKDVTVKWSDLKLPQNTWNVRDLWSHENLGKIFGKHRVTITSHDVAVYRLGKS